MVINFKFLTSTAMLPRKNSETDAGIDFFADENYFLEGGEHHTFSTGVAWEPYFDAREDLFSNLFRMYMQLQGRSGLASRDGIAIMGGVIDPTYRGEIKIILVNTSNVGKQINRGDKIAQGIVLLTPHVMIKMTKEISDTERGASGFGSSGT
jgi:dUTP pyrophosphatase